MSKTKSILKALLMIVMGVVDGYVVRSWIRAVREAEEYEEEKNKRELTLVPYPGYTLVMMRRRGVVDEP